MFDFQAYGRRRRKKLIKLGKCAGHPNRNVVAGTTKCQECHKYNQSYLKVYGPKHKFCLRLEVLQHYCSGVPYCQCPGCRTVFAGFLQVDHVKPKAKRKEQHGNLYSWLKKHGYPKGFQVLCANCNGIGGKGIGRRCPMHGKVH